MRDRRARWSCPQRHLLCYRQQSSPKRYHVAEAADLAAQSRSLSVHACRQSTFEVTWALSTGPPLVSPSVLRSSVLQPRLANRPISITIPPMRATSHSCSVAASPDGRLVASGSSGAQSGWRSHALVSAVFGACRECRLLCRALALREDRLSTAYLCGAHTCSESLLRIAHAHLCTVCATRAPTMQRHDFGTAERYVARPTLVPQRSHGWCNTQHPMPSLVTHSVCRTLCGVLGPQNGMLLQPTRAAVK